MDRPRPRAVVTSNAPTPQFSYSQGVKWAGLLFIAGQVPVDPHTGKVPELFGEQVRQVLQNLSAIAEAGGTSLAYALRVGVFLKDFAKVAEMDGIYRGYFDPPLPARTTVQVGLRGFEVEMDAIVALDIDER